MWVEFRNHAHGIAERRSLDYHSASLSGNTASRIDRKERSLMEPESNKNDKKDKFRLLPDAIFLAMILIAVFGFLYFLLRP